MAYDLALDIDSKLATIVTFVERSKEVHADEIKKLREIIDGLLANWPHTEITKYYTPDVHGPVLMKQAALERAAAVIRSCEFPDI